MSRFILWFLVAVFMAACNAPQLPAPVARAEEGSTVTNGGGQLEIQLYRLADGHLLENLKREINAEQARRFLTEEEFRYLLGLLQQKFSIRAVTPSLLEPNRFYNPGGSNSAEVRGDELLDSKLDVVQCRVVWDARQKAHVIQVNRRYLEWLQGREKLHETHFSRLLFHEILRLAYFEGKTRFADENYGLSSIVTFLPIPASTGAFPIIGNRKVTFENEGFSYSLPVRAVEGQSYEGLVYCSDAHIENWLERQRYIPGLESCHLRVALRSNPKNPLAGTLHFVVSTFPNHALIREGTREYYQDGRDLLVFAPETTLVETSLEVLTFGEALLVGSYSSLFRIDYGAPSVVGRSYFAEPFVEVAAFDLVTSLPGIQLEWVNGLTVAAKAPLEIHFLHDGTYRYEGPALSGETEITHRARRFGRYTQVGTHVLLGPPSETAETDEAGQRNTFWLRPDRLGAELISPSGETWFATPPADMPLSGKFSGQVACPEVYYRMDYRPLPVPPTEAIAETCSLEIAFLEKGEALVTHRRELPVRDGRPTVRRGHWLRAGNHVQIRSATDGDEVMAVYKLLANGEMSDIYGNVFSR